MNCSLMNLILEHICTTYVQLHNKESGSGGEGKRIKPGRKWISYIIHNVLCIGHGKEVSPQEEGATDTSNGIKTAKNLP